MQRLIQRPSVKADARPIVVRLDDRHFGQRKRIVYRVKHVPALDLANTIGELLEGEPPAEPAAAARTQSVALVADVITNTLIISASPQVLEQIVDLVEQLDRQPPMVQVRTLIAEIAVDDAEEGEAELLRELSGSVSDRKIDELAAALKKRAGLRILRRTQVTALDNQPAYIQLGQRVPRVTGAQISSGGRTRSVSMEDVGLTLGVTARVNADGLVTMEIDLKKSDLGPVEEGVPVAIPKEGDPIRTPTTETLTVQTTISAASGQTVVLGGIATKSGSRRSELIMLVSPRISRTKKAKQ